MNMKNKPRTLLDALQMDSSQQPGHAAEAQAGGSAETARPASQASAAKSESSDPARFVRPERMSGGGEKRDHLTLILVIFLCFSAVAALLGYAIGQKHGYWKGIEQGVGQRSKEELKVETVVPEAPVLPKSGPEKTAAKSEAAADASLKILPVTSKRLTSKQESVLGADRRPGADKKPMVTLKVQEMGRKNQAETRELVETLKSKGFDAHADYNEGHVFVGRFSAIDSPEAIKAKKDIATFDWKKRDFKRCYFVNLPKYDPQRP